MKGVVFNILEQVVRQEHGEAVWDDLLDDAGVSGAYTALGNYPDAELLSIVGAASHKLDLPAATVVRWFGRHAIPLFAERYPSLFTSHRDARSFLLTLNDIIHPEVRKLYPGAEVPEFRFETPKPDVVILHYASRRKLCAFAEGLIEGAAEHYGDTVRIEQRMCALRGDPECVLVCRFSRKGA